MLEEKPPWAAYEWVDGVLPLLFGKPSKFFHSRIAGVTFPNPEGCPARMDVIRSCEPGELLLLLTGLLPEFPESVIVTRRHGEMLGFLPKEIAHEMRGEADRWRCCFQYVTHPEGERRDAGASVCLMRLADKPD
jgi:hypothetical protein